MNHRTSNVPLDDSLRSSNYILHSIVDKSMIVAGSTLTSNVPHASNSRSGAAVKGLLGSNEEVSTLTSNVPHARVELQ